MRFFSRNGQWKGYKIRELPAFIPTIPFTQKEWKVTSSNKIFLYYSLIGSTIQDGDSQVRKKISWEQRLGCLHRLDGCLFSRSDPSSIQKVSSVHLRRSNIPIHGLTLRNVPKSVDFHQIDGHNSIAPTSTCHFSFSVLDDWLIRDLIRSRLLYQTKYCLQIVQGLAFIPNLKVGTNTSSEFHVHRHGISDTAKT